MTIVFGWNNYRLKSVSLLELGILNKDQQDLRIEYRQKYFHLFWIPVFPIGRFWGVKKEGKWYQVNPELEQSLSNVKASWKASIWAWTMPLLALSALFIYRMSESMERSAYRAQNEKHKTVLSAFFQDKNKTAPLDQKLKTMNAMIDSSFEKIIYEGKRIDTSESNLIDLYLKARLTQMDSLQGFDEKNTYVISEFPGARDGSTHRPDIINGNYATALEKAAWNSNYGDTSAVFNEIRKLDGYKYILVLKEYNRVAPQVMNKQFKSGYLFAKARILSIETGKEVKKFQLLSVNSDQINHFSSSGSEGLRSSLDYDLMRNSIKDAKEYVFGKQSL